MSSFCRFSRLFTSVVAKENWINQSAATVLAISTSGTVYGWGMNEKLQSGCSRIEDSSFVKNMHELNTVSVNDISAVGLGSSAAFAVRGGSSKL
ncbi:MAG: hypothetical protein LBP35_03405 [Candidatus Ancillula trichonymphae]|nr:hypothetical protein [Candidatus Ancillula trichonymphae]